MKLFSTVFFLFLLSQLVAQESLLSTQPVFNTDRYNYQCDSVEMLDFAEKADGFFLFLPAKPKLDAAPVIVFIHGYGAINPKLFGKWITHLVRQGNIIIYPRYQKNLFSPRVTKFTENAAEGIRAAIIYLQEECDTKPLLDNLVFFGHSYGGVIATNLAVDYELYEILKPEGLMICAAGTAKLKAGMRKDYTDFPADIKLIITTGNDDKTTGDFFGLKLYNEAKDTKEKVFIKQYADHHGVPAITAGHNAVQCIDEIYDSGINNYTARHSKRVSTFDVLDFNGYWEIFEKLINCVRSGDDCDVMDATPRTLEMGKWSDGMPINSLRVIAPNDSNEKE